MKVRNTTRQVVMVHGLEGGPAAVAVDAVIDLPDDVAQALVDTGQFQSARATHPKP